MDRVKSVNLDREYSLLGPNIENAVRDVMSSGRFVLGSKCQELENKLADYCGTNYAITVANGTDALRIALLATGISPMVSINVPDFTFAATAEAVISVGASVNPVEVDSDFFQMKSVSGKSIVVDLFGAIHWTNNVSPDAEVIIEDAAQAIGATSPSGERIGSVSDVATISFYPTKTLGAYGDAGALVTNNRSIAAEAKLIRDHHMSEKYIHSGHGFNSRMDEIQAAILLVKFPYINSWIKRKRDIADRYISGLSDLPINLPKDDGGHTFHQFTIQTRKGERERLRRHLDVSGIDSSVFYPTPISSMYSAFNTYFTCKSTTELCSVVLSLPICPHMTDEEVERVIRAVRGFYKCEAC